MNIDWIATSFLRWYNNVKKTWGWEDALDFYLKSIGISPDNDQMRKIKKSIKAKQRSQN